MPAGPSKSSELPRFSVPPPAVEGERQFFARAGDGTNLYVRALELHPRKSPRVIFCDGILCDGFIWKYQWPMLSKVANIGHWHYRGHGRSGAPIDANAIDIPSHAEDLREVIRALGDEPSIIVGHSMGCQVALEFYRHYSSYVSAFILECGSFGRITATFHGLPILELVLPRLIDAALKAPDIVRAVWSRIPAEMALKIAKMAKEVDPDRVNPDDMLPYLRHMTHVDFPMFLRMLKAAGDHTAGDLLAQVTAPTLVIAGERDTFTPAYLAEATANAIPGAEMLMVHGGTHVAPIEQPEVVEETILNFLRNHSLI